MAGDCISGQWEHLRLNAADRCTVHCEVRAAVKIDAETLKRR
jgi:hypothetical protein